MQKISYISIPIIIASCIALFNYKKIYNKLYGRKLLILDMNGLIVDKKNKKFFKINDADPVPGGTGTNFTWKRPCVDIFIDFALKNYDVAVWSSAQNTNVQNMIDFIFEDRQKELIFIWDQSKCVPEPRKNSTHPLFLKPINEVLRCFPEYKNKILFIDDSPEKLKYNEKFTSITPSSWDYTQKDDNIMNIDGKLVVYLNNMLSSRSLSVQDYVMNNPY